MAVDPKNLIAAIVPDIFCQPLLRDEVKKIAKEKGYLAAAEKAKLVPSEYMDVRREQFATGAFQEGGINNPIEQHFLKYDMFSQNLEPLYFWLIDYISMKYGASEKLTDNFVSAAASGHFVEMQGRASRMQQEATKLLETSNAVLRSILNLVYDLKEFKLKLVQYDDYHSPDEKIKHAATLSLKQNWMDNVDLAKRGTSALKQLAAQYDYVTVIDAFMAANSLDDVKNLDLNDRVKRIIEQRIPEFFRWIDESEAQLRKRYEIEKLYLRSQVNTLKLYSRWVKPYLKAAKKLEQNASENSALVTAFNTALFELTLVAKSKYGIDDDIWNGELPEHFKYLKLRNFLMLGILEFYFRTSPGASNQQGGYTFRGRTEIKFTSCALREDEYALFKKEIEKDDIGDMYKIIGGATTESLARVQDDIDEFLSDEPKKSEKKEKMKNEEDVNPFSALFSGIFSLRKGKSTSQKNKEKAFQDTFEERGVRNLALMQSRWMTRMMFREFKKSLNMPALPPTLM